MVASQVPGLCRKSRKRKNPELTEDIIVQQGKLIDEFYALKRARQRPRPRLRLRQHESTEEAAEEEPSNSSDEDDEDDHPDGSHAAANGAADA